jgi:hypothetical protein
MLNDFPNPPHRKYYALTTPCYLPTMQEVSKMHGQKSYVISDSQNKDTCLHKCISVNE